MGLLDFLLNMLRGSSGSPAGPRARPGAGDTARSGQGGGPRRRRRRSTASPVTPETLAAGLGYVNPRTLAPGRVEGTRFRSLMACLGLRHTRVRRVLHSKNPYASFTIAKRDGGLRDIVAPCRSLKHIQRRVLHRILEPLDRHDSAHGFRRGRSTATNAAPHAGKEMVLSLDLESFFPSISSKRVYGLLRALKWPRNLASMLTRVATWQGALPQGAPTSPAMANLVARRLDQRLAGLAKRRGLAYTRYADDLTLSGAAQEVRKAFPLVRRIVEEEGFKLARHKMRFMRRGRRQTVTGLTVNDGPSVPRDYRRRVRAALHQIGSGRRTFATKAERRAALGELEGHVNYIRSVRPEHAAPLDLQLSRLLDDQAT